MQQVGNRLGSRGFTIVELLIVIVIIGILAALIIVAYNGIQSRARDTDRIVKVKAIAKAIEQYYVDKGYYPTIQDGGGYESSCGSQTDNWGHCDRNKVLTDAIAPYLKVDPESLSNATQGNYYYYYTSQSTNSWQYYGLSVKLEGSGGQSDGGYYTNEYEVGNSPDYCMDKYSGSNANWHWVSANTRCGGGD
ncbi:MAG: prepilin-type N-terminal cleavage/methylation domain-containing protein [Candidatus Saccharibacteria bacterium]|nr:prepilin-type N-terminal cleavage/methylation domain-containing protein [Candidatus Saccharibacteria bacterium]